MIDRLPNRLGDQCAEAVPEMKDMITHIYKGLESFLLECSAALVRRRALGGSRSDPRQLREERRDEFRACKVAE
ncbi:hypothetical protein NKH34_01795 [Mesorhizobium sp. M1148]|uniref:hypothetical protein n=1 Tax=unclassified Mesorhizobium TaxID=325217 RepID=UPI00333DD649